MTDDRKREILRNVHVDGGRPTEQDLIEIEKFKAYLQCYGDAKDYGLDKKEAQRLAAMEVYGNINCE